MMKAGRTRGFCALLVIAVAGTCEVSCVPSDNAVESDAPAVDAQPGSAGEAAPVARDTPRLDTGDVPPRTLPPRTAADTASLTIHFSRGESTAAVLRNAPAGGATLRAALGHLLRGPTAAERAAGIHSWFSSATADALRTVTVQQGRAVIDFADLRDVIPNASTSAGSAMLLRELNTTVFEFPSVQTIEYRIEGSCERFWEWLQYGGCPISERT